VVRPADLQGSMVLEEMTTPSRCVSLGVHPTHRHLIRLGNVPVLQKKVSLALHRSRRQTRTFTFVGWLEGWWWYCVYTPRSLVCVVCWVIEGQEAHRGQVRGCIFDHLAFGVLWDLFLVMLIHQGDAGIISQFYLTRT
jgi:hypothetical protein